LTFQILARFFSLGILAFSAQFLGYKGIGYSSPTLASAMSTIAPATTFVLAVLFRMEKLEMNKLRSQLKTVGTIITIAGAIVVVLYKGPVVINTHSSTLASSVVLAPPDTSRSNWIMGGGLLAASYFVIAIWYIFQAKAVNDYPAELVVVFFVNLFSCIVATPVCFITEPNLNAWRLKPDVRLYSCLYSGIIGSGLGTTIHTWGLHVKGPVYVALFRPLSIAIAVILGVLFLGDNLYLGSIIGALIISMGFYIVTWGKSQEEVVDDNPSEDSNVPLLA
jgi:drug/metabolite transporter (DMT)-like permease